MLQWQKKKYVIYIDSESKVHMVWFNDLGFLGPFESSLICLLRLVGLKILELDANKFSYMAS